MVHSYAWACPNLLYYFANETLVATLAKCAAGDVPELFGMACRGNKPSMAKYFVFLLFAFQETEKEENSFPLSELLSEHRSPSSDS